MGSVHLCASFLSLQVLGSKIESSQKCHEESVLLEADCLDETVLALDACQFCNI